MGIVVAYTGRRLASKEVSEMNIRQACITVNEQFTVLSKDTGLDLAQINVGAKPGDCTGDSLEAALLKISNNLAVLRARLAERPPNTVPRSRYDVVCDEVETLETELDRVRNVAKFEIERLQLLVENTNA